MTDVRREIMDFARQLIKQAQHFAQRPGNEELVADLKRAAELAVSYASRLPVGLEPEGGREL